MSKLYIVATPIGNLKDITFRAVETLKEVDVVLCEDTRVTKKLLDHYEIKKPLLSYHQRSGLSRVEKIVEYLENGKNLALVTDAGTPGISDPGNELIGMLLEHFQQPQGELRLGGGSPLQIISIPGPSALTALVQVAGINLSKFVFLGFPPNKKGRETFFKKLADLEYPAVYYDSPYRFVKNLELLKEIGESSNKNFKIIVGRELTKMFEEIKRGNLEEILEYYQNNPDKIKGEFVVIAFC